MKKLRKEIYQALVGHNLSYTEDGNGNGLALVDRLTPEGDTEITRGSWEIWALTDVVLDAMEEVKK